MLTAEAGLQRGTLVSLPVLVAVATVAGESLRSLDLTPALPLVTFDSPAQLDMIFRFNKNLKIKLFGNLIKKLNEKAFHY